MGITLIEWAYYTFNPWIGCTKVSPGCQFCYAEADMDHRRHYAKWGPGGTRVMTNDAYWSKPFKWDREARAAGTRRIVFCSSLADVFEDWKGPMTTHKGEQIYYCSKCGSFQAASQDCGRCQHPTEPATMDRIRQRLFYEIIDRTPNLIWLLLTKRPGNIEASWPLRPDLSWHWENVWIYTSVENQKQADLRIPELAKCRELSPVLGLSCEPLLEEVQLRPWLINRKVQHVIVGGESGPQARPFHSHWAESLKMQCRDARIPFFMKQFGSNPFHGSKAPQPLKLADRKGGNPEEWPAGFNIRQMPEVA